MATAFIASKEDKQKAQRIEAAIDNGDLPKPPPLQGRMNECSQCHEMTMFARYYIPRVSWCCARCWDNWLSAPVWCTTRADQVHRGRFHIAPVGLFELYDEAYLARQKSVAVKTAQSAPSWVDAQVAKIKVQRGEESLACEARWHAAVAAGMARRGNVMTGVAA